MIAALTSPIYATISSLYSRMISVDVLPGWILAGTRTPAPEIKENTKKILDDPEFESVANDWFQRLLRKFFDWLDTLFEGFEFADPNKDNLFLIASAALIIAIIVLVALLYVNRRKRVSQQDTLLEEILMFSASEWITKAKQAEANQLYQEALLHRWRALVAEGISRGVVIDNKGKTTKLIEKDFAAISQTGSFTALTRMFEKIRYGGATIKQQDYVNATAHYNDIQTVLEKQRKAANKQRDKVAAAQGASHGE